MEVGFRSLKDGKEVFHPVWFTVYGSKLELLPMHGLKTKWFLAVMENGEATIRARGGQMKARPAVLRQGGAVDEIKARFSAKYGERDVRRYYPTSEVALEFELE